MGAQPQAEGTVEQRAQIIECQVEPPGSVFLHTGRYTDSTRFSQGFETGSHVHTVSKYVIVLGNDIADVDADAKLDATVSCANVPFGHATLPFGRTTERIDDADEFDQKTVSGRFDDVAQAEANEQDRLRRLEWAMINQALRGNSMAVTRASSRDFTQEHATRVPKVARRLADLGSPPKKRLLYGLP